MAHYRGWMGSRGRVVGGIRTIWTSYGFQKCQPQAQTCLNGVSTHLPIAVVILHPCLPCSAFHGSHCLSHEFTGLAKLALEKQTSQPSPVMAQCQCSIQVQPVAGPIKWNRSSVTIRLVFQNPVTYRRIKQSRQ